MKLEKWGLIAEIVGAFAIVVTLVMLIFEIRGNTEELRAAALTNLADRNQALMLTVLTSPQLVEAGSREIQGEELNAAQRLLLDQYFAATLKAHEESFIAYRAGRLEEEVWQTRANLLVGMLSNERQLRRWVGRRDSGWYVQDFVDWLDRALEESGGEEYTRWLEEIGRN